MESRRINGPAIVYVVAISSIQNEQIQLKTVYTKNVGGNMTDDGMLCMEVNAFIYRIFRENTESYFLNN